MKKICIIFCLALCHLAANGQDYYSNVTTIKTNNITYSVDNSFGSIHLENERNTLLRDMPFDRDMNEYCRIDDLPSIYFPNEWALFKQLATSTLFLDHYESYFCGSWILIHCAVNPKTALIEELLFDIHPGDNKRLLSIPPERFAELEKKLVGHDFGFKIPDRYKNMTYCISGVVCSFK